VSSSRRARAPATRASGRIAVFATEGTVQGGAYERAIHAMRPDAHVTQVACQIFVALAEEGWSEGEAVDAVTERYLAHLDARVDTVVLGLHALSAARGRDRETTRAARRVVDSAATTARATRRSPTRGLRPRRARRACWLMATDSPGASRASAPASWVVPSRRTRSRSSIFRYFP
jgi:glutamate racemase